MYKKIKNQQEYVQEAYFRQKQNIEGKDILPLKKWRTEILHTVSVSKVKK